MRRLPVYFLIDVSESMIGEPIQQVEEGLSTIITELKKDPYALETVYLSILVFAGKARTIAPLTDIISFYPPRLPVGGGTSLGVGLKHLVEEMNRTLVRTTLERKGDWKPIVFLFTDGAPTDQYEQVLAEWDKEWKRKAQVVAVSFGDNADTSILSRITDQVLVFKNADVQAYKEFFKWITASIQASSQSVNMYSNDELNLAPSNNDWLEKVPSGNSSNGPTGVDTNVATFLARCSTNRKHYLMKYNREMRSSEMYGLNYQSSGYRLAGSYALGDDYFALTDDKVSINAQVSTEELHGYPHCPCCGNSIGFCLCSCGNLLCFPDNTDAATCPWCSKQIRIDRNQSGDENFDVNRTQG